MEKLSPEEILENIKKEEEKQNLGKLKIFLGYSAGVGKTYHMLDLARELRNNGLDVVIGYIEKHDRKETLALLEGFEILPTKQVEYKNITLNELDLNLIIKRKPELVIIDELAHTNSPDSKNKKRYEDIQEILKQGIDVYTTLNIQHIESLSSKVKEVTKVKINEIVPDEIVKEADNIELIDIEPEELLARMNKGKVYKLETIENAKNNFFTLENLIKLREIALQYMVNFVDRKNISITMKKQTVIVLDISLKSIDWIQKVDELDYITNSNIILLVKIEKKKRTKHYQELLEKQKKVAEKSKMKWREFETSNMIKEISTLQEQVKISKVMIMRELVKQKPLLPYRILRRFKKQDIYFKT